MREAAEDVCVDVMIEKCGEIFTIRGAEWKVNALKELDHLGVMPRPDPRVQLAMEENKHVSKD